MIQKVHGVRYIFLKKCKEGFSNMKKWPKFWLEMVMRGKEHALQGLVEIQQQTFLRTVVKVGFFYGFKLLVWLQVRIRDLHTVLSSKLV